MRTGLLTILLFLAFLPMATLAKQEASGSILPPQMAFPASANALDAHNIAVHWNIRPGYYLYRDKFSFKSDTAGIKLGKPLLPPATIKDDKLLGQTYVYTHAVTIRLPITRDNPTPGTLTLEAVAQGCVENRVCYPPFSQTLKVALPSVAYATRTTHNSNKLAALITNLDNEAKGQFLQPDQAFRFSLRPDNHSSLIAHWDVAPGYHLYKNQITFVLIRGTGLTLGSPKLPPGKTEIDPILGRQIVYTHPFDVLLPIKHAPGAGNIGLLKVHYQGCADKGICYAPITKTVQFRLPSSNASTPTSQPEVAATPPTSNEQGRLVSFLLHKPLWMSLGLFFLLGLGLAFTPCIFPLFPILSGIIVGQRHPPGPGRTFLLSLVYVLAMALTYTMVGVIVGLTGASIQAWFQNPWVLSAFAAIFVLLALSMFGFYELQMPNFIQSRVTEISNRQRGGSLVGVGIMGFLSALIVGPCVTAPLVATLIVIANTGNAVLGGLSLFALSIGMGLPLLIICTAFGRFLPKAGPWMDGIKRAFGVLMLGVGIWMLSRFLPAWTTALLTGLLLIISSVYLGAFDAIRAGASGWYRLWKGVGLIFALWGILIFIGIAGGGGRLFTPLQGLSIHHSRRSLTLARTHELTFTQIKNLRGLNHALAAAEGKPVMLDFYADWCVSCKELDAYTFSDPRVQQALSGFVLLQVDDTANNTADQALLKHFGLYGPPGIVFFNPQGHEMPQLQVVGYIPAARFIRRIRQVHD